MSMRLSYLGVLVLVLLSLTSAFCDAHEEDATMRPQPVPYTPIPNITDPHVVEIAEYAVKESNKQSGAKLKLVEILKGETQTVPDGVNYRLVLKAKDASGRINKYRAVVYENHRKSFNKKLISFQRYILD